MRLKTRLEALLVGHEDWVRCVAWAPNLGLPMNTLASCGQDGKVLVWTQPAPNAPWAALLQAGSPEETRMPRVGRKRGQTM